MMEVKCMLEVFCMMRHEQGKKMRYSCCRTGRVKFKFCAPNFLVN